MRAGEVYVNPASGERAVVVFVTDETAGQRVVVDLHLRPNGGMAGRQYYPKLCQQCRVFAGSLAYTLNGLTRQRMSMKLSTLLRGYCTIFGIRVRMKP